MHYIDERQQYKLTQLTVSEYTWSGYGDVAMRGMKWIYSNSDVFTKVTIRVRHPGRTIAGGGSINPEDLSSFRPV